MARNTDGQTKRVHESFFHSDRKCLKLYILILCSNNFKTQKLCVLLQPIYIFSKHTNTYGIKNNVNPGLIKTQFETT